MRTHDACPSRILVVDDDLRLRELLIAFLGQQGIDVYGTPDAESALNLVIEHDFDLYILDINLPGKSGWDLCSELRSRSDNTPIIMLTARSEDNDRIQGLELGADDYLPKPFNTRELLARIKAVLRRFNHHQPILYPTDHIVLDDFRLDTDRNQLLHRNRPVLMTATELRLFKLLYKYRGRVISRTMICQKLHGRDHLPDDRSVDVLISRIRKYLGLSPDGTPYIQTVRNQGYTLIAPKTNL